MEKQLTEVNILKKMMRDIFMQKTNGQQNHIMIKIYDSNYN